MKLADVGEFQFIHLIEKIFRMEMPSGVVGIGDDCAVIPRELVDREMLVTSDLLVEGTHFRRETTSAEALGYKTLAVNLSDVAAMGGKPQFAFLSLALPRDLDVSWVEEFLKGFRQIAMQNSVALLGGDTTRADSIFINVTILGSGPRRQIKRRTLAMPNDLVVVTGSLGDSNGGLQLLELKKENQIQQFQLEEEVLVQRHLRPRPQVKEGLWLGRQPEVHAMMDVSDGIVSDLERIREQSNCGFEITLEHLPISKELKLVGAQRRWDVLELAACGGEDFVLLLTVDPERFERLNEQFIADFGVPLTAIGHVTELQSSDQSHVRFLRNGRAVKLETPGFDHFRSR